MRYKFLVTRTAYSSIEVEVEADCQAKAEELALDKAANTEFPNENNADYDTELILASNF